MNLAPPAPPNHLIRRTVGRSFGIAVAASMVAGLISQVGSARPSQAETAPVTESLNSLITSDVLPFDLPAASTLRSSPRKVFAHYWPPMTVSLDDVDPGSDFYQRNYLNPSSNYPTGASAYGGMLRDRPFTRPPIGSGWRLEDAKVEVRQAASAGLDGFLLDIMQLPGDPDVNQVTTVRTMMQAAAAVDPGFKIVPQLDMGGSLQNKSAQQLAAFVAELAASPAAYRLDDGRLVVSTFYAETMTIDFWTSFLAVMRTTYGIPVAFAPTLLDEQAYASAFAPISWMIGNWGSRNPAWTDPTLTYSTGPIGRIAKVHALGVAWMQPVSVQDERPRDGIFDEAGNTQTMRNTWQLARDGQAEWVMLPTWNDYTENAQIAPSVRHGWSYLDLTSYFLTWYKAGTPPAISRDTIYLTHRTQPWQATPTYPQSRLMNLRGGTPARDTVEALTFMTAPGTVTVTVGGVSTSCSAQAGLSACTVPLRAGSVSALAVRNGATVASVVSPSQVTTTPYVQDLQYVAVSSGRQYPGGYPVAAASASPTPTAASPTPTAASPTPTAASPTPTAASPTPTAASPTPTSTATPKHHGRPRYGLRSTGTVNVATWRLIRRSLLG